MAFRKLDYVNGLNGHNDFASANTLRNSIVNPINMDSKFDRFKVAPKGGYFSNTAWNESTLQKNVSLKTFSIFIISILII